MGFQGQLASVNLTDIFQTLNMNRQTGTLSVTGPVITLHIFFDQGNVVMCTAPMVNSRPYLLDALVNKGHVGADKADELVQAQRASGQPLRDVILSSGVVADYELDELSAWCVEELVCPVFEWTEGDFTFSDGDPVPELNAVDTVSMGGAMVQTTQLVMEATRRMDEWKRIREVITDPEAFYIVDNDGRANLKNVQTDPDMLKVLRYLDGRHTLDQVAMTVGVTRFDTFAIVAQLVLAGVARPKNAQEVVEDAVGLIQAGEVQQARDLLESTLKQAPVPEVMRPLADCCVKLNQAPRAVELYLELIQMAQDQGDLPQALKDLDTVIGLSPDDPDLHFERGQVQAELGQVEPAAGSYSTAAQAYLARKDLPRAIDACHRAKNLLPRAPEPHRYLARAYLLEGQTENAVVEYKSLWHALLTAERPKKALETLRSILDADCKYNNVKDQVLSHAQNSEAIKTSKAARYLVYVVIAIAVIGGAAGTYEYYEGTVKKRQGDSDVTEFEGTIARRMDSLEHRGLLEAIDAIRSKYPSNSDVILRLEQASDRVKADFETRAEAEMSKASTLIENGRYEDAEAAVQGLKVRYQGSSKAAYADDLIEMIRAGRVTAQVSEKMKEAESLWTKLAWDEALAILQGVLARTDLPSSLRDDLVKRQGEWSTATRSAQVLFERAQRIESGGASKREALVAFRRAAKGEGQQWIDNARTRVLAIEMDIAREIGRLAQGAAQRGDDQQTFACVDELATLAQEASSRELRDYLGSLELPFTLQVDNHHVQLTVKRQGSDEQRVTAPSGKRGSWSHRVAYRLGETVSVEAMRAGFAPQQLKIDVGRRKTQDAVTLARGPRWRKPLSGAAATRPLVAKQLVLIATDKTTIDVIDPALGVAQTVRFKNSIENFQVPPTVFQDRGYAVLGDRIFAFDITTRSLLGQWPDEQDGEADRLTGHLWVQEHEIKPGQLLLFAPTVKAGLQLVEIEPSGRARRYPRVAPDADITGAPFVDHPMPDTSLLYLPAGNTLKVYDVGSVTEVSPPRLLYDVQARGDLIGRPVKAKVGTRELLLMADMAGQVLGVECDPRVPEARRRTGWILEGTSPSTPVLLTGQPVAVVSVVEGRVYALDLAHQNQLLWSFPTQGRLTGIAGGPVVGQRGVYVADAKSLHCLDPLTGGPRWKAELPSPAVGGIVAHEGRLFVPVKSGELVCFEEGDE